MANGQQAVRFPLGGGMDLVTPAAALPPGRVIASLNYEPVAAGYRRLRGFERFDGSVAPSVSRFYRLDFTAGGGGTAAPAAGTEFFKNGDTGAGNGIIISITTSSGVWISNTAAGHMIVAFVGEEVDISVGAVLRRASGSALATVSAITEQTGDLSAYVTAVTGLARATISEVPGSGPVRLVFPWAEKVYAIRDNVSATAAGIYYAGAFGGTVADKHIAGWKSIGTGYIGYFDQGGIDGQQLVENTTYDDGSGAAGASSTVYSVVTTSGSWDAGDAAGHFLVTSSALEAEWTAGDYLYANLGDSTLRVCRVSTAPTAVTIPAGGSYSAVRHNFYGASDQTRLYIANGVGKAFELGSFIREGSASLTIGVTPISTGMVIDTPTRIAEHRNSLFLSFPGGSVQFSVVGEPLVFDATVGAGELSIGNDVQDFATPPNSLAILGEHSIHILYGNDASDYTLEELSDAGGALPHTAQEVGGVIYMDNRGLRRLSAAQGFANFSMGTLSTLISPLLEDKRRDSIEPSASLVCRTSDQYWLFFEDGTGFIAFLGGKNPAILPFDLGITVTCATSVEDDGVERLFVGASNGFVYELNKGTSFDGVAIEHYLRLPFHHFGSSHILKRVHKVSAELDASGTTTLSVSLDYDYGRVEGTEPQELVVTTGGGAIDDLGSNELYFASQIETLAEAYVDGVFTNVSLKIGGETSDEEPHTLTGVTYHITARGVQR